MNYFEGNEFFFFLFLSLLIGFVLRYFNKNIEYYVLFLSVIFALVIYSNKVWMLAYLIGFIVYQYILVYLAQKRVASDKKVRLLIFLSLLPLIVNKIFTATSFHILAFIGISYMSFKTIQIMIEISDGIIKEKVKIKDYLQFLLFFPTVSAGPIDRSRRFLDDFREKFTRAEYLEIAGTGVYRVILGLLYKIVFSTFCYHYLVLLTNNHTLMYSVKYMYLYSLYLFFDFAGYSLMAVGSSNILGIKTPMNFNKPFLSVDIKDFWNRWHITLSTWLRDFVFSRVFMEATKKKRFKKRLTTAMYSYMINMLLMGFWHGVTVSYIVYGFYHGILMAGFEYYQKKSKFYKKNKNKKVYKVISWFITINLVVIGLYIFSGEPYKIIVELIKK